MSNGHDAAYTFLPLVRQGIIATMEAPHPQLAVRVNDRDDIPVPIQLYGPGDVTGIDARVVVRTEPRRLTSEFEPNYLAAIEFDRPDFPWMFSPPQPSNQNKVSPWLCLVVVSKDQGTHDTPRVRPGSGTTLPVLTCAARELPDLKEAWAWAHTQVIRDEQPIEHVLTSKPELNVSRLVCPRKLEPNVQYYACVVPVFRAGVEAGLGTAVISDPDALAWDGSEPELQLPVYYSWEFSTGAAGDFEALAKRLRPALRLPQGVGQRALDLNAAGFGLPSAGVIPLGGALRAPQGPSDDWPARRRQPFQERLTKLVNAATEATVGAFSAVTPPIYGRWHAGQRIIDDASRPWLRELNLDPRHRVAASVGARVIQEQQEQLMASAWEQLGELRRANQLLRQAQLARSVARAIHQKRFQAMRRDRLLQICAPVLGQVSATGAKTVGQMVRESSVGEAALSAAFRRTTRPRGPIVRRMPSKRAGAPSLVQRLASGHISFPRSKPLPPGMGTVDTASEMSAALPSARRRAAPRFAEVTPTVIQPAARPGRPGRGGEPASTIRFRQAAAVLQRQILRTTAIAELPPKPTFPLDTIMPAVLTRLDPETTIAERIKGLVHAPDHAPAAGDPLEPIMARPQFPQPMIEPLKALSQDFILPGLELVPVDTVTRIEIDRPFIEAYMVGLNHEMSRELLWREFPTDQRGTYFKRFWNTAGGAESNGVAGDTRDVETWTSDLGANAVVQEPANVLVLLVRGELLRRYPGAIISIVRAQRDSAGRTLSDEQRDPVCRGSLDPDVVFVGFDLSVKDAVGSAAATDDGWYLVVQEQPTEPRFGFENSAAPVAVGSMTAWFGLGWADIPGHVTTNGHLTVEGPLKDSVKAGVAWGRNSAHMAAITLQAPFRVAIHFSQILAMTAEDPT